jgi:hypothetical protein
MEQKIAIKIEGPTEEKVPFFFNLLIFISLIFISLTLALLVVELMGVELPKYLLVPIIVN